MKSSLSYDSQHRLRIDRTLAELVPLVTPHTCAAIVGVAETDYRLVSLIGKVQPTFIVPNEGFLRNLDPGLSEGRRFLYLDMCSPIPEPKESFDILILTEVLEHLMSDDNLIMENAHKLVRPGGILFITVPNAAALRHRLMLLLGVNIHWSKNDILHGAFGGYGHLREYTVKEIVGLVSRHFTVLRVTGINGYRRGFARVANLLPKTYANTILVIARKGQSSERRPKS